jgi:selenocysteine lyase/cysteine desulfurase
MGAEPDWEAIRHGYPGARQSTYLDTACKGLPAPQTAATVMRWLDFLRHAPGDSATADALELMGEAERARQAAAAFIGAKPGEIALVQSTQHGLLVALEALDLQAGDAVVTSDLEFLAVALPLRVMRKRRGIDVRVVGHRNGSVEVSDLAAALDARTRAFVLSSVQEVNGSALDLSAVERLCLEHDVRLVLDAVQHVGAAPMDVSAGRADFVAVGGHKWLGAPIGCGFLYVRRDLLGELTQQLPGYMAMRDPADGWDWFLADRHAAASEHYELVDTAQYFETGGTPNAIGAAALASAIDVLREIGATAVHGRVSRLAWLAVEELDAAGVTVTSPRTTGPRSGIVSFSTGRGTAIDVSLVSELARAGVRVSARKTAGAGGIRVSPFVYNNEADIRRLATCVADALPRI